VWGLYVQGFDVLSIHLRVFDARGLNVWDLGKWGFDVWSCNNE